MVLIKRFHFDSAHRLPGYKGICSELHGHRWYLELTVEGPLDIASGMIVDFKVLDEIIKPLLPDHKYLNNLCENPTAENLAIMLHRDIAGRLPEGLVLRKLRLWESEDASVEYP